jgi:hypothetical protein
MRFDRLTTWSVTSAPTFQAAGHVAIWAMAT